MLPLAHAGGWDEILLFAAFPVLWLVFNGIGRLRRRALERDERDAGGNERDAANSH